MKKISLIPGDGVGPEITQSIQAIFDGAHVPLSWDVFPIADGKLSPEIIKSIQKTGVLLKGPLATPVGHGHKSLNVILRKAFDTYANVRPVFEIPNIKTPYQGRHLDFVVIRENTEDLYAGIEYDLSPNTVDARKIITQEGCERICRFAFDLAQAQNRPSVHCATKANILKKTEGLLKETFQQVAQEYPEIDAHHIIVDNCAHQLVIRPEQFSVLLMSNMNGDILSDQASGLVGGLGVASSYNRGSSTAIFEAVHGSAPDIAGKDLANPTALLWSAIAMLRHLDLSDAATRIENALLYTFEQGIFTKDLDPSHGLGTQAFTQKIIDHLDMTPENWTPRSERSFTMPQSLPQTPPALTMIGVDIYIDTEEAPDVLGGKLKSCAPLYGFTLEKILYRGLEVYPEVPPVFGGKRYTYQCRFSGNDAENVSALLDHIALDHHWVQCQKVLG